MSAPVLAVDLGGTRLKWGFVDEAHRASSVTATPLEDRVALDVLVQTATAARRAQPFEAGGIAMPGVIDQGVSLALPGKLYGLQGVDVAAVLRQAVDVPWTVINDAQAYALGESAAGAARDAHRAVVMTIGTGVGVAVVEDGRPLGSGHLGGGTFGGHIPIAETSRHLDSNGKRGTIEALCAAPRILDGAEELGSVEALMTAARAGEHRALAALTSYRHDLVSAIVALAHAHAPEVVVVGGGPLSVDDHLLEGVERRVGARLFPGLSVRVRRAELGDAAALVGVAALARGGA
ncbi:MAG: ROK family protein [Candidatus Dormibacteria bacterium]